MARRDQEQFRQLWQLKSNSGNLAKTYIPGNNQRVDKALQVLSAGERLLDIGCGTGVFGAEVQRRGLFTDIYGIDISEVAVEVARQNGMNAQVVNLSNESLPYPDAFFETITMLSTLQYIYQPLIALKECCRTLKPNGRLLMTIPNMRSIGKLYKLIVKGYFPNTSLDKLGHDGGTINYFCYRNLVDLLTDAGFNTSLACGIFCRPTLFSNITNAGMIGMLKREFFSGEIFIQGIKRTDAMA